MSGTDMLRWANGTPGAFGESSHSNPVDGSKSPAGAHMATQRFLEELEKRRQRSQRFRSAFVMSEREKAQLRKARFEGHVTARMLLKEKES